MARTWWGSVIETGELSATATKQAFILKRHATLRAVRLWIIAYNSPIFANLTMKIYSNNAQTSAPGIVIKSSTTSYQPANIYTLNNAIREIYFQFDDAVLEADDTYWAVLQATSYTFSDASHLAVLKSFPNPINTTTATSEMRKVFEWPWQMTFIDAVLT